MNKNYNKPTIEKPRNMWKTIRRLIKYMRKSSILVGSAFFVALVGTVMQVLSPKLLGNATTLIFTGAVAGTGIDYSGLFRILLLVTGLYAGVSLATFVQERIMLVIAHRLTCSLRNELKNKMNRLPVSYFDQHPNGNLMSVATNDIDNIVMALQQSLTQLPASVILVVGIFAMMLYISPLLTLLAGLMVPASLLVMKILTPRAREYNKAYFQEQGDLSGQIEETYQGFTIMKSFQGEKQELEKFQKLNEAMYESGWRAKFSGGSMMPWMLLAENIVYVGVATAGALKVLSGTLTIGDMQAFLQYSKQFSNPLAGASQIWGNVISAVAAAERVFDVLDEVEMNEPQGCEVYYEDDEKVVFDHIVFGYNEEPVIHDFTLSVKAGEMIAVVGQTGAGKTTLINLLERFYDVQSGTIRVDGVDIRTLDPAVTRQKIGMVLQDTWLFNGTIYENIRYGNPAAAAADVYAAARASYADEFIRRLPQGYQTVLSDEAGNISQGQKQLLTIARALISDPEILILDEATSNVDSRTEMIIQQAMKRLLQGRTSFVVAHRLATIYDADRIIVMARGNVAEIGSHQELLAKKGVYADIYYSQFYQKSA